MGSIFAVAVGGSLGSLLRWLLGITINSIYPAIPLGTLIVNLLGGYLIGVSIAFFGAHTELAPEWRLLVITGFLGGLTTFSTFSAEVVFLVQQQRFWMAGCAVSAHVIGSLVMTLLGIATVAWVRPVTT